jgi:hypothetical protein
MSQSIAIEINRETAAAVQLLAALADELDGDVQAQADTIEGETNLHEIVIKAIDRLAEIEVMTEALKAREDAYAVRRGRFTEQAAKIKRAIVGAMDALNQRKIELATATVYTSAGRRKAIVTDETKLPPSFFVPQPPKLDTTKLTKALVDGASIDGATLSNASTILNIRTR